MTVERQFCSAGAFSPSVHNDGKFFTEYFITQFEPLDIKTPIQYETLEAEVLDGRYHR